eukprot:1640742-Rhodomonas_salina.1
MRECECETTVWESAVVRSQPSEIRSLDSGVRGSGVSPRQASEVCTESCKELRCSGAQNVSRRIGGFRSASSGMRRSQNWCQLLSGIDASQSAACS